MVILALMLSAISPAASVAPDPEPVRRVAVRRTVRPPAVRSTVLAKPRVARRIPSVRLVGACVSPAECVSDPNLRYRLTVAAPATSDAKYRVLRTGRGMACGTTGAPVCPGKGMRLLTAPID